MEDLFYDGNIMRNLEYDNLVAHIKVVKIDQLTLRCLPAESYSQRGQRARCFPQESAKFPKDTFSRNDSIYLYETPFWILKSMLYKETDRIVVGYAADFIITAFFRYISTLHLKFYTLRYEFQTLPTKMRIIKQEQYRKRFQLTQYLRISEMQCNMNWALLRC